jgi:hypothetical protein
MANEDKLDELNRKLDLIVRILAYQLVSGKTLSNGAPVLKRLGLSAGEIAAVFDTTPNTVNVRLTESKKAKKAKENK